MSLLVIDIGNTRCKWAAIENGQWLTQGVVQNLALLDLSVAFANLPQPSRILVANVAGAKVAQTLVRLLAIWQVVPEFVVATGAQAGVTNGYDDPAQLGCDRWAALIAAWHQVGDACLVVNCGTATTIDALSPRGEFLGGLILPGIDLMRQSLAQGAAQLTCSAGAVADFPRNTADAILSGVIKATAGAIDRQSALLGNKVPCLLSGGAAELVRPQLACYAIPVENLVLIGLQIIGETKLC